MGPKGPNCPRSRAGPPRKRVSSIKAAENRRQSTIVARKRVNKHKTPPLSSSSDSDVESLNTPPPANKKILSSPPNAPDISYFMVAQVFIGFQCIYRVQQTTKVNLFSARNFLDAAAAKSAEWSNEKGKCVSLKSSVAKPSCKAAKPRDILSYDVNSNGDFHRMEDYLIYMDEAKKKALRVDWKVQYEVEKDINDIVDETEGESEDEEDMLLAKPIKRARKVTLCKGTTLTKSTT